MPIQASCEFHELGNDVRWRRPVSCFPMLMSMMSSPQRLAASLSCEVVLNTQANRPGVGDESGIAVTT